MTDEILSSIEGSVGHLSLNRPKAIHALNPAMCEAMTAKLLEWRDNPAVEAVVLDHAEGRGFCAGGDVRAARDAALEGNALAARSFFHTEYRLNNLMFSYPKPIVAFMDGVTMGGGVGISQPAQFRVATENTMFAMPEGSIGLFPDVGAGYYLPRLPGRIGQFLALTAARLDGAECLYAELATHYLRSDDLAEAKARIGADPARIGQVLDELAVEAPPARIEKNMERIDRLFASDVLEDILAALDADDSEWAAKEAVAVRAKCPTTSKVALRQFSTAPDDFAEEMKVEYRLAARMVMRGDFAEGVRAVLIDRDGKPQWDPAEPHGVSEAMLDEIFAALPAGEEWTPLD